MSVFTRQAEPWDDARIREAFIYDGGESEYYDPISGAQTQRKIAGEIFDRWLAARDAAHDAEVRAQALTITDEMVERAARVFYKSQTGYDLLHSSGYRNHWLMLSRAALEAAFRENRSSDS